MKKYQQANPKAGLNGYLFGNDILEKLCSNPDADGIWVFKVLNNKEKECFVLFPAEKEGNILSKEIKSLGVAANTNNEDDDEDDAANDGQGCPPYCPEGMP